MKLFFLIPVFVLVAGACSVLKKEDPEKNIRDYLLSFQSTLSKSEDEVLKEFETKQTREVLLTAIRVLQNKQHEFIVCEPAFGMAAITLSEDQVKVEVRVTFRSQNLDENYAESTLLTLWLKPNKKSYVISKLDAEEFYKVFAKMKNDMEWEVEREREYVARDPMYKLARVHENNFDSVIWFTKYSNKNYFYVVSGSWDNWFTTYDRPRPDLTAKMGLIDEGGEVVIPIEFDLIGTIGFDYKDIVEVEQNGKLGWFDISSRKLVIPVAHNIIIPYKHSAGKCIVKTDSTYGWYSNSFEYKPGFPDATAEQWVNEYKFIPTNLHLDGGEFSLCEIPLKEQAGYGIIVMPSYLVKTGVFKQVICGISPTEFPLNGYIDYVETTGSILQTISKSVSALVTTIKGRYLDGREEFYTHSNLVFVGEKHDTLSVTTLYSSGELYFKKIDSLLEVKSIPDGSFFEEGSEISDAVPIYNYFRLTENIKVQKLESKRTFPQTQYVKLDSSYLSGDFSRYNYENDTNEKYDFLSLPTIKFMRNEILASYGVKFTSEGYELYSFKELEPKTEEEVIDELSETDSHNVKFLDKIIQLLEAGKAI
jgi:hypothetical protein